MSTSTPSGPSGPEYLDSGTGGAVPPERPSGSRKRGLVIGGAVAAVALLGGAAWAATSFLATGDQPAEALPAGVLGYASVDLDPSGGQKVAAIRTLRKFPAFTENTDIMPDDDIKQRLFEEIIGEGECEGLDYGKDVEPWLGDRAAVAALPSGEEKVDPVFVLQVSDAGAAEEGIDKLITICGGGSDTGTGAWKAEGDWLVVAETDEIVSTVVDGAADASLADDADFQKWTGEAGDAGVMTFYASPDAGPYIADLLGQDMVSGTGQEVPEELKQQLAGFGGAAAIVRFDDGGLEAEMAAANTEALTSYALGGTDTGGELVTSLPGDTLAAYGIGFPEGWLDQVAEQLASVSGMSVEDMWAQGSQMTGLDLPGDAETLFGEGVAVAVSPDIDPDAIANGGPGEIPVAVKIKGDPEEIDQVLEKIRSRLGAGGPTLGLGQLIDSETNGDYVVLGPNADYRAKVAQDGGLGESETFAGVVAESDKASGIMYVDFNGADNWLSALAADDPELKDNLEPLAAFGASSWVDGDTAHGILRVTTD